MTESADRRKFPKVARVRSRLDFTRIYEHGSRIGDRCLLMTALRTEDPRTRLGLSVSKRCGNAVRRNRWKRVIREVFRLARLDLPTGFDLVIQPRPEAQPEFEVVRESFGSLMARLQKRPQGPARREQR